MTGFKEYDQYDALGLAELVKKGDVTSTELLEEAIARTEKVNDSVNAVVHKHYDEARAAIDAGLPDGPFTGVPFLLKDLHLLLEGTVTTYGSGFYRDHLADHDSTLVERYKQAGLVTFGKTNSPELGLMPVTEPRLFGPTRNPWDLSRTPGGSSGGASAAVASGIVPMANASDGGGSIRIPASCTGLVGLKPTRGRTPMGPDRGEGWAGQSISHVVSRSVRDSAAALDATTGEEPGNPYEAPHFAGSFLDEVGIAPGKLRIAICRKKLGNGEFSAEVTAAVDEIGELLQNLGHQVEEAEPEFDREAVGQAGFAIIAANTALAIKLRAEALGREVTDQDIEPSTQAIMAMAGSLSADDYARATLTNHQLGRVMGRFHQKYDLMLAPTLSTEPVPIGFMAENIDGIAQFMADTALFNQTGQPAISLPLCWSASQLPIGIMFVAAFGNDALLMRIAGQLEQARPWWEKRAPVHS
ncbi:MAG TPA: amidase [Pseudomonadales bacterium]|jgi:amidase/6-aminohexanoate-cyclic-dimer hydrolase|nr:amidase [Pseudomonadales bacterium]MDP6314656.1 amidase [Pseudomonadales bacterium]MDP7313363.1 amidase [Pseudomonadales bacterium]HJP51767.1 amidase [Pseudomonadales bacterium]|tara:strand:- start:571 stop:1983 length:1413 start_codon:yes stop_codon:yes gene_type:complete